MKLSTKWLATYIFLEIRQIKAAYGTYTNFRLSSSPRLLKVYNPIEKSILCNFWPLFYIKKNTFFSDRGQGLGTGHVLWGGGYKMRKLRSETFCPPPLKTGKNFRAHPRVETFCAPPFNMA